MTTAFGPNMKARRVALGLTLRDVEIITNGAISNGYLSQLENGRIKNPSARIVVMLCASYMVSHVDALAWLDAPSSITPPKLCGECRRPMPAHWVLDGPQKRCFTHCGDKCDCGASDPLAALPSHHGAE